MLQGDIFPAPDNIHHRVGICSIHEHDVWPPVRRIKVIILMIILPKS
jgi:hypothetical protein